MRTCATRSSSWDLASLLEALLEARWDLASLLGTLVLVALGERRPQRCWEKMHLLSWKILRASEHDRATHHHYHCATLTLPS